MTEKKKVRIIKKNHDIKSLRRRLCFKQNKKLRNKEYLGLSQTRRKELQIQNDVNKRFVGYKIIKAPKIFSLLDNTEELLSFIHKVDVCFNDRKKVFIRMKYTTVISYDAIVVLLSKLIQFKANKIEFNGDFPKDRNLEKILRESGFIEYLYKNFDNQDTYTFDKKIYTHANKNVNPALTSNIIGDASKKIWKEKRRCPGLQRVFIELMQNTNNHASNHRKGEKLWWSSIVYNKEEEKVCFSFIDYGVGILDSLKNKETGKFAKIFTSIKSILKPNNNADVLMLLLEGKIHELIKEQAYNRGKGLPGIFKAWQSNDISNLIVITNNVYANVAGNKYLEMRDDLSGTFIYWELNRNNKSIKD
jgi:hypothetical protein